MGKVIKNVVKTVVAVVCGLLLTVLVVPLAVSLVVSVPAVQNALVKRLTEHVSQKLGVRVAVDRVDIKLVNRVELEGFYVEDFDGDTLLYVPRLVAPIEKLGLWGGVPTFGRVSVTGAQLWLGKAREEDQMNISRVVDAIRGDQKTDSATNSESAHKKKFQICIKKIEGDSIIFALNRGYRERRERGVDFSRFVLRGVHTRIDDFAIAGDTIRMNIRSLGATERSGLVIDNVTALPLIVSRGAVVLENVDLRAAGSVLDVPAIRLVAEEGRWSDFGVFSDSVAMGITMRSSRVTTDLVGAFVPAVAEWGLTLDDVSAYTRGVLDALAGGVDGARISGGQGGGTTGGGISGETVFSLDFTSRGLPHLERAAFDGHLTRFESGDDLTALVRAVTGGEVPAAVSAVLGRLGAVRLTGAVTGGLTDFDATASLVSGAGDVDLAARMVTDSAGRATIDGRVATAGLDLGRMVNAGDLGRVAGVVTGTLEVAPLAGKVHGDIAGLEFRDYTYTGLGLDAGFGGGRIDGELRARDPALTADVTASVDRSGAVPGYTVGLDLRRADLAAMRLDRKDSVSVLSGRLAADVSGLGLDDATGRIELTDASYSSEEGTVTTSLATLSAYSGASGKVVTLLSEFADAEFRSRTDYRDIPAWLGGFLGRYISMPRQGGAPESLMPPDGGDPAAVSNYSIVSVNVKNTERLLGTLAPSAAIAEGSSARFMFNPYTGGFSLSARSDFVEMGGVLAADIEVSADNAADSLTLHVSGTDVYSGRGHIPRFELHGGAKGGQRVDVSLDGRIWHVEADSMGVGEGGVGFGNLNIFPADDPAQRLTASGVVSGRATDTLHVRLNRFDLSPLGELVGRGRVKEFAGRATGWLDVASVTDNPRIDADIELRQLAAAGRQAPPLRFVSRPEGDGGVRFRLTDEGAAEELVAGSISARGEIEARVRLDSMDAALLDPLLGGGVLTDTRGVASARLTVGGTTKGLNIDGYIDVPQFETTVAYTRVRYGARNARLRVENSVLTLPRTAVTNPMGGSGDLALRVDLSNLRDIRTEIEAHTEAMLAFDTGQGDNEAFYGRVFATGSVGIRNDRMGTRMDISGRTDAGTQFHLPLNAKSNVSWADFVVFADRTAPTDTTDVLARKRLAYERRLAAGTGTARRSKPLELNLTASITPAAEVHMLIDPNLGQGITGRGEGVIDMKINPASDLFTMTGDYNIASGRFEFSMMNVFNKTFEIAPGSTLRWSGAPDDALLGVDASYRVRTSLLPLVGEGSSLPAGRSVPVDCIIRLRESLSEPEITFDIALPSADAEARQIVTGAMNTQELKSMQFLSLLTTGSFATDNSITGQSSDAGIMATGAVGFDILTNQLNNFLSSEDYDIYFRYRPQDNFATSQFDMGFSTRLWNDRLQLEIEGNYIDDRAATSIGTTNATNLAGDVSLTWVIDRAGNLRLKVFSQTIDRLNETQGLQESGLGIYYKREFDNLRDIFRKKK